jgi:hypothetical protein
MDNVFQSPNFWAVKHWESVMSTFLSREVHAGLDAARRTSTRSKTRLNIHVGSDVFPILSLTGTSFSVDAEVAPRMRGLVDIYDGTRHLSHALIVTSRDEAGRRVYEFKRSTPAASGPARDFEADSAAPAALLPLQ